MSCDRAAFPIPTYLRSGSEAGGPERMRWLEELPERVADLSARRRLRLAPPFEPGGSCSWVAPGLDADGREIVLKIAWRHPEAEHEPEGMTALAGLAAPQVYAVERAGTHVALLLERCVPGDELRTRPEAEQHEVIVDLLQRVWSVGLPADHPFRPLTQMADYWVSRAEQALAAHPGRLDHGLARDGLALFRELARTPPTTVLLCTDLHAGNVLSASGGAWLLIDPKPYVGDPHYDLTQHLLNCEHSVRTDPVGLVHRVAGMAGLDADRVRQWLFARCVQESLGETASWRAYGEILRGLSH